MPDDEAIPASLIDKLNDPNWIARKGAVRSLQDIRTEASKAIAKIKQATKQQP
jgi:hypothetical protein